MPAKPCPLLLVSVAAGLPARLPQPWRVERAKLEDCWRGCCSWHPTPMRRFLPERGYFRRGSSSIIARRAAAGAAAGTLRRDNFRRAGLCSVYIALSASGPMLFDWIKQHHGGRFPFSVPALTFHAYAIAALLGLAWTVQNGRKGFQQLLRLDMLWRFCITTSLFTMGDILSFHSIQHLDLGTFSLVGKAVAIILTVLLSRLVIGKRQSTLQYTLVSLVALTTTAFCLAEVQARGLVAAGVNRAIVSAGGYRPRLATDWFTGLVQRTAAVCLTSLAAVLQEKLLTREPHIPFLLQQCWMGCAAMAISFFTMRVVQGQPSSYLFRGFDDWRVIVFLLMFVANGMSAGLMVKRLGATAKALCVPFYLGLCYVYAVQTGSAALTVQVVAAWLTTTACILLYAVTKATGGHQKLIPPCESVVTK